MLKLLSRLVAPAQRRSWLREWEAELRHANATRSNGAGRPPSQPRICLDAAEDAMRLGLRRVRPGSIGRDVWFALRVLRKSPLFTSVAVLTLALGIGANTAIFTVVNAALLRPLGYAQEERLVQMVGVDDGEEAQTLSLLDYEDYRARSTALEETGYWMWWATTYQGREPIQILGGAADSGYFRLFAGEPELGRYFSIEEDAGSQAPVVVLSYGFWQAERGGDPDVVGSSIALDDNPFTIVGVAPREFRDPLRAVDLWYSKPAYLDTAKRDQAWLISYARLGPGVTLEQAQTEIDTIAAALESEYPQSNTGHGVRLVPIRDRLVGDVRPAVLVLLAAVVLVLLIACANVANLLLTRSAEREREMAVRISMGASRGRLARQLVTESLVLSILGGALGVALSTLTVSWLAAAGLPGLPAWTELRLDLTVLAFAATATLLTGLLFGLAPLRIAGRTDTAEVLKEGGRGSSAGARNRRTRTGLVIAELALSTMLLIGAGLMLRSFYNFTRVDPGLDGDRVLTVFVMRSLGGGGEPEDDNRFYAQARERIAALPGVEQVAMINALPMTGFMSTYSFQRDDRPAPQPGEVPLAEARVVSAGYFETMGVQLATGRTFARTDRWDAPPVAVVNEALAARFFSGEQAVGKKVTIHAASHEIVGVIRDVHQEGPAVAPQPALYTVHEQRPTPYWLRRQTNLVIRAGGDPMALADSVRAVMWELDPEVPLDDIGPFDRLLERYRAAPRFQALLLGMFAVLATVLAAIGITGVMSYNVTLRTHEIGVRRALGAQDGDVLAMMLRDGTRMAVAGVGGGLLAAAAGGHFLRSVLFGVAPIDVPTFAAVGVALLLVAMAASYLPARRATRVDPVAALRSE